MAILTPKQMERLKKILEDASKALAVASLDHQLTTTEIDRLVAEGYLTKAEALNIIEGAYKHGAILTRLAEAGTMNVEQFQTHLKANPLAMSPVEKLAFENARDRAGTFCVGLGNKWSDKLGAIVINADKDLADRMREDIKSTTAVAIAKRKTAQELRSDLRQLTKDYTRDWDRIAQTEIQQAHQEGYFEHTVEVFGEDELLAKVPESDACEQCIKHYTENGIPIIRPASWWQANGVNNVGRKTADWKPVIGAMHPYDRCRLQRVPKGWGITADGELLPPGVEKSFSNDPMLKAYKLQGRRKWHGLDISIENKKGSVRKWYDPHAKREGSTKMHFAYGYVKGSLAADGDHCDVYIGPDETATNVYVVHQMKAPDFKAYDEDKSMLQFKSAADAKAAYIKQYDNPKFFGSMTTMTVDEFKKKVLATRGKPAKQRMLKSMVERGEELMSKALAGISLPGYLQPNRSVGSGTYGFHQDETKKTKNKSRGVSTVIKQQNFKERVKELLAGYESHPPRIVLDFKLLDPSLFDAMGGAGRPPLHKRPWETVQGEHLKLNVETSRERLDNAIDERAKAQEQARATARWSPDFEAD